MLFAKLGDLGCDDELAVRLPTVALEVLMVIGLGGIEWRGVGNLGHDGLRPQLLTR